MKTSANIAKSDFTICLGINCKVKKHCYRYGLKANSKWQSYMAACVDKYYFIGKPRWKKVY